MQTALSKSFRSSLSGKRRLCTLIAVSVALSHAVLPALADFSTPILPPLKPETAVAGAPEAAPAADAKAPDAAPKAPSNATNDPDSILPSSSTGGATDTKAAEGSVNDATTTAAPNSNLTIDDVKIEGNRLVPTADIMHVVKTHHGDKFDRDQVMNDLKAINGMGYFDDRSLQVAPELTTGGVLLKIHVQENAPVTEFSFQGNKVLSSEDISKVFSDQLGKPQNLNQLSSAIDKVEQLYHQRGYILSRVTDVKDDPDGSIGLTISEGTIDKIQVVGNKKTLPSVVDNYLKGIKQGSVYNDKVLTADLRKLYAQGYFSDIRRSLQPSADNPDRYTLKVEVDEKRSGTVGLGGGVDSLFGPFGSLNVSDTNFMGHGTAVSLNGQVGTTMFGSINNTLSNGGASFLPNQRTFNLTANYLDNHLFGTDNSMDAQAFGRQMPSMLIENSMQQTIGASTTFSRQLGHGLSASLGFTAQNTSLWNGLDTTDSDTLLAQVEQRALNTGLATDANQLAVAQAARAAQLKGGAYLNVSPTLQFDTRNSKTDPTEGTLARISATPSLGLTNASVLKLGASVSQYIPLPMQTTLALNTQAGTSYGNMPQFMMYNLGGFNGIRGYRQFTDLGIGTGLLMGSAEIRGHMPFLRRSDNKYAKLVDRHIKWDIFSDAGQVVGNGTSDSLFSRSAMGASVGVGVRVNLPMIGVVRLDYGFPLLNSIQGGFTPRFTVGFGNNF
ncbi:MAG TPA: BamA/TamA family outer membrane protein [Planktothrix sp.]|jgi:outer membrane protein insertion porin family